MTGRKSYPTTQFHDIADSKGWLLKEIAERWNLKERQMSRIAQEPKPRDLDAVAGLPDQSPSSPTTALSRPLPALDPATLERLQNAANQKRISVNDYLAYLLEEEKERQELLAFLEESQNTTSGVSVQHITQRVNQLLANIDANSEIDEFQECIANLYEQLIRERIIKTRVLRTSVAESQRLKIPRVVYYWYGAPLAKHCGLWFGCYDAYLYVEGLATNSEVIFIGMPENVLVSYLVCNRLCQLLKKVKAQYKKSLGAWGNKQELEDEANNYMARFVDGITSVGVGFMEEDDYGILYNYVNEHYRYTLR